MMRQFTSVPFRLPASILVALLAGGPLSTAVAQDQYRVIRQENFRREPAPDGRLLASINLDTELEGDSVRAGWVRVTIEGWIWAQSLRRLNATGYDYEVVARSGENLRGSPNGPVLARLSRGFWLREEEDRGDWIRVSRPGWIWGRSLQRMRSSSAGGEVDDPPPAAVPAQVQTPPRQTTPRVQGDSGNGVGLDYAVASGRATLHRTPEGDSTGQLVDGAPVRILTRSGPWVRVRTEAWVHEDQLRAGADGVLIGVSGAEVRARPTDFEGQLLQWTVKFIALQVADDLRPELPEGSPYLLARGPLPEAGFVYVLMTDEQVGELEGVTPLADLVILARVRVGRSRFLGNPVLELVEMSVRQP